MKNIIYVTDRIIRTAIYGPLLVISAVAAVVCYPLYMVFCYREGNDKNNSTE